MSRVSLPHLDIVVGQSCELRCVGCTNGIGMMSHLPVYPLNGIVRDIADAAAVMVADKVTLLGGEALLHKRLVEIIAAVRDHDLAPVVQVLTNGIALHRMADEFWDAIDWLKISIYPGRTPDENVQLAREKAVVHGFELDFYDVAADPFRAVHTRVARDDASAQETYAGCWYRTFTRKLEDGYFWRCCTSASISKTLLGIDPSVDGLRLADATPGAVEDFLARASFMESCRRCHGHSGPSLGQWAEHRDKSTWLEVSAA